jgi:hypothetical protein
VVKQQSKTKLKLNKMKRFLFSMAALLAVVGCAQQEDLASADLGAANAPEFKVGFESSRVYIDETDGGFKLAWTKGDLLSCFLNAGGQAQYEYVGETGEDSGIITAISCPNGEAIDAFYAVYPYNEANSLADGVLSLVLPAEQAYAEGTFGANSNAMVAVNKAKEPYYTFSNVCGYIRLKVWGEAAITSIKFEGLNDEIIAGAATYNTTTNELAIAGEGKTITLNCGDGVTLGATEAEATEFWVVVPPKSFEKGFTVTLTDSEGNSMEKVLDKPFTVDRNAVHTGVIEYEAAPAREVIFDAQFQANGDAIDGGKFGMTIQKMDHDNAPTDLLSTYTNSTYASPIARFLWTPSCQGNENYAQQKADYYLVDFSENDEFKAALADGFTVEAVYMTPVNYGAPSVIVGTNTWSLYRPGVGVTVENGSPLAASVNTNIDSAPWSNFGTVSTPLKFHAPRQYHHAMYIYDYENNKVSVYVDGVFDSEIANVATFDLGYKLAIGARPMKRVDANYATAIHHWSGDIAMVKMYNNAFTADEVAAQYAATTMPTAVELPTVPQPIYDAQFESNGDITNKGTEQSAVTELMKAEDGTVPYLSTIEEKGYKVLNFTHAKAGDVCPNKTWNSNNFKGNDAAYPEGSYYRVNGDGFLAKLNDTAYTIEIIAAVGNDASGNGNKKCPISTQSGKFAYEGPRINVVSQLPHREYNSDARTVVGEYHHVVYVLNIDKHGMQTLYYNGKQDTGFGDYGVKETNYMVIGACYWADTNMTRPFNGKIAAIRVYDEPLSPWEVATLYEDAKPIVDALNAQ